MTRPRKTKADTVAGRLKAAQAATAPPLEPLAHTPLPDAALPFWRSITSAKSRDLWTDADLETAASLAILRSEIARKQAAGVDAEKDLRLAMALGRSLQITSAAIHGKSWEGRRTNEIARESAAAFSHDDPHGLLAGNSPTDDDFDDDDLLAGRPDYRDRGGIQ